MSMAEARRLDLSGVRAIVTDGEELAKGARVFDDGGLTHLSRYDNKLFADAKGSGASPYKVQIIFEDDRVRGRCSCMAARSRPFCKHSAGLLVAWARGADGFAVSDVAPAAAEGGGGAKKKEVKKGKTDNAALMRKGVEQAATLVRELAVAGVASQGGGRAEQLRALSEAFRENKLRRIAARTLDLASKLSVAASRPEAFDAVDYADTLSDLFLTARKIEKHLDGEALEDRYVEELIGKTWTKKDRKPISGLELVEYAFTTRTTPDDFIIRESRFMCVASGEHYSEKQILPGFLAKRTDPKKSWAGRVLRGASGSLYPTFSPMRLDLEDPGAEHALGNAVVELLLQRSLGSVGAALAAFQERRKDVFAPDTFAVAVAVDTVLAEGARMRVCDEAGAALFLPDSPSLEDRFASVLRDARLRGLIGDVTLDGALPTLFPLAAIIDTGRGHELRVVGAGDAAALLSAKKVKATGHDGARGERSAWTDVARAAGASTAAVSLGEIREELADALGNGLSGLVPRLTDPLATRLTELGLAKQGALLAETAKKSDPAEKLEDFVKLYQVLGIALTRLAGAAHVDRTTIEPVPTYDSVFIRRPERFLEPREIAERVGRGSLSRYEAAAHYARFYATVPPEELAQSIYPTWADGSASRYVARAFAQHPAQGLAAARRALGLAQDTGEGYVVGVGYLSRYEWRYRTRARMATFTAIDVLEAIGNDEAKSTLVKLIAQSGDEVTKQRAGRALRRLAGDKAWVDPREADFGRFRDALLNANRKEQRVNAIEALVALANPEAIPYLRASYLGDVASDVRERAAYALARLGDADSVDTFIAALRGRHENNEDAKVAAYALGIIGDVRGIEELLAAWSDGWNPYVVCESLQTIGTAALAPLVALVEERPELAERKAAVRVLALLPIDEVTAYLHGRLEALKDVPEFPVRATMFVALAAESPELAKRVVAKIVELRPQILDKKTSTTEEKALARKCAKHLG
jgi:hypothetical protein